jgi:predicted nucleotidyltransferase
MRTIATPRNALFACNLFRLHSVYCILFHSAEDEEKDMKSALLDKVRDAVKQIEPSAEIILYGSRARNDFREYSDWDFLVLVDGPVDTARTDRVRHLLYEIELETGEIISSIVKSRELWNSPKYSVVPLHRNVEREGIVL